MAIPIVEQTVFSLQAALLSLWASFLEVFPGIIAALVVLVIGGLIGLLFGKILTKVLQEAKIDEWLKSHGVAKALEGMSLSGVLGSVLKWYIIVVFLGEAAALVKLAAIQVFMLRMVSYVPSLIGAFIILLLGLLIGEYAKNSVIKKMDFKYAKELGKFAKFLIVYFSIVIGLQTAQFDAGILEDAFRIGFTAIVIIVAVVFGATFAWTFRKDAEKFWNEVKKM
ncbi:MAG: hypothetical protein ABH829_02220 [archaeon]